MICKLYNKERLERRCFGYLAFMAYVAEKLKDSALLGRRFSATIHTKIYIYICACIRVYMRVHIYVHVYICICVYVYMYIYNISMYV